MLMGAPACKLIKLLNDHKEELRTPENGQNLMFKRYAINLKLANDLQSVKIACLFLHGISKLFHYVILSLSSYFCI